MKLFAAIIFVVGLLPMFCDAYLLEEVTSRDPATVREFRSNHPCPATGKTHGACPGYVVDHIIPLCAGGPDRPDNMQWQTKEEAHAKDLLEWEACRNLRRQGRKI